MNVNPTFKLVLSFPPSIEFIEISGELEGSAEKSFFYAFSLLRESSVPNLKTVYAHVADWPDHFLPPKVDFQFVYKKCPLHHEPHQEAGRQEDSLVWIRRAGKLDKKGEWSDCGHLSEVFTLMTKQKAIMGHLGDSECTKSMAGKTIQGSRYLARLSVLHRLGSIGMIGIIGLTWRFASS